MFLLDSQAAEARMQHLRDEAAAERLRSATPRDCPLVRLLRLFASRRGAARLVHAA